MAIQQVNERESHLWRSKTLRLLSAPPSNAQPGDGRPSYSAAQKTVCRNLAIDFYTSPAQHLIKPPTQPGGDAQEQDNACLTDLEAISQHAGELSSRLWSRRTALRVKSLAELKDERFVARSELMKAHPLHRLYEDDDECDGWLVGVVTHPAVLGFGSGDGRDYTAPRVWMKAEVWLAKDI
ncbi:hypothetical protein B0J18DRAFT_441301 [Chaetomium sp. MPI-SDFR-AT-0129]|nr:hypothetical protein B0J18DRAFT_441301 [Chaetomium sp. MPI-SDFR-AT-0129]